VPVVSAHFRSPWPEVATSQQGWSQHLSCRVWTTVTPCGLVLQPPHWHRFSESSRHGTYWSGSQAARPRHWRQPRRGCRGHIAQYFGWGGTSTGISPPILLHTFGYSRPILVAVRSLSLKPISFGYKTPPVRFNQAGGQSAHKARPPNLELALTPLDRDHVTGLSKSCTGYQSQSCCFNGDARLTAAVGLVVKYLFI